MKNKFKKIKKDSKSFSIIVASFILMALFLVGGSIVNISFNSLKSKVYTAATESGFNDEALYTCVVEAYNSENNGLYDNTTPLSTLLPTIN